ncbi:MAG TPA: alpha/beta hydrolase [Chloroflexota bacterium]|jgi:pimeloyl-ACP methyl ester carboxylesterase|nr:alpha/beta hydrolase [Chloroflexota bacterium]
MSTFTNGNVSIYYEERGSGPALLLLPPGGMNATVSFWARSPFLPHEVFADEYRTVAMDQRNAGSSRGPLDVNDPWNGYIDDQLALMDHLGIERFHVMGCCIGCSYALLLAQRTPDRVLSAVLEQPIGVVESNRQMWPNSFQDWAKQLLDKRGDLNMADAEAFGRKMWSGDFVLAVTRDWLKTCDTPFLVLPGSDTAHPHEIGVEVAELAPRAEIMDPWKTPELTGAAIQRIRAFLQAHTPAGVSR